MKVTNFNTWIMAKVCLNSPLLCQYSFLHCLFDYASMLKGINIKDLQTIQHSHLDHCEGGKWYYLQTMTIQAIEALFFCYSAQKISISMA